MIIDISKVTEGNLYDIDTELAINKELTDDRGITLSDGSFSGWYCINDDVVASKGEITFTLSAICDNCLEDVKQTIVATFQATFTKGSEEDNYHYENYTIDMTQAIDDSSLLSLPSKILCKEDCKGLCAQCGQNLNKVTCSCCESELGTNNPFYILKSNVGGVKNGITKKKNF